MNTSTPENIEISVDPQDLPNFKLTREVDPSEEKIPKDQPALEIAKNFLIQLDTAFKKHNMEDLLYLYDKRFNKISETVFKNDPWPEAADIEASDEDLSFDINTLFLYGELCYRHIYARLP